jgi:predicted nucleotide-binding protein (sugar kinase/HSP70/actin superfamily)
MIALVADRKKIAKQFPNVVDYESKQAFRHFYEPAPLPPEGTLVKDVVLKKGFFGTKRVETTRPFRRTSLAARERLTRVRIGIPRVLNIYSTAPYFRHYFEAIGIPKQNVVFSDATTEEMWVEGGKYGSIDPCFPSKVAQAHVHNLLFHHHSDEKKLDYIFFPILTHVPSFGEGVMDKTSCPIVAGVPDVMKAAFTKEVDFFATRGIEYLDPALTFSEMNLTARRMFETWGPRLGITEDESDHAHREAMRAFDQFERDLQDKGRAILETVEAENRVAILMVARPYHSDPGLNHGIPEEFQVLGYPILSVRSIPRDMEYLSRYFKDEIARGQHPLNINDVWPENYSANSAQKVWAVKFAARHPNVVLLDLSSFKCGHDAPTYGIVESIVSSSATPYAALHDIDANKPGGSIKIRVKTYAHSLKLHEEALEDSAKKKDQLSLSIDKKRLELLTMKAAQLAARQITDPALAAQIAELGDRLSAYVAPVTPFEQPKGLVTLKKKNADGNVVATNTTAAAAR